LKLLPFGSAGSLLFISVQVWHGGRTLFFNSVIWFCEISNILGRPPFSFKKDQKMRTGMHAQRMGSAENKT
jgi:hypothetical protein